ncbi:MAG: energy-coupling factor ABC transporter permease [Candidatus Altiarchaeota archaeon]|nr:energy-coupling factor ABC transporter permease [Candidatus Altiarchaeota archaeon]
MHIPDGFLSTEVWLIMWALAVAVLGYAIWKTNERLGEKHVPMLGVLAAFIFAAQMLNTPVAGGTSGHMLGGVLAAVILGPFSASIIMATVFIVQGVFFQDGGITTLGANIFNMGLIGTVGGYYIYYTIKNIVKGDSGRFPAIAVAAWLAVVLASAATSIEIAASGIIPIGVVLPAMVSIHMIIGLIEAAVSVVVVAFILKTRPDLLELQKI